MADVAIHHDHVVLDACCIINIAMTGEFENILEAIAAQFVVVAYVRRREALTYINHDGQEVPISLDSMIQSGLIQEAHIDYSHEDEPNLIIALEAQNLEPGEAESAAVAINRSWAIATDDRHAINMIAGVSSTTQILTTPELIKLWADSSRIADARIAQAIKSIRRYTPPKNHTLIDWWQRYT